MLLAVHHKKTSVLEIPLHPPLPKGDNKDYTHIFMRILPTHFNDEPEFYLRDANDEAHLIGILPERRKNPSRINRKSIMKWGKLVVGESLDFHNIYFV